MNLNELFSKLTNAKIKEPNPNYVSNFEIAVVNYHHIAFLENLTVDIDHDENVIFLNMTLKVDKEF